MAGCWSCSCRPFEKMTMQRKNRSKGRALRAQSLQAQFQVLAQSSTWDRSGSAICHRELQS